MTLPLTPYGRSTSIKRGEQDFPLRSNTAYLRIPPSNAEKKIMQVARDHLPRAEADIWPSALSIALAPGPAHGIAPAEAEPPSMLHPLHKRILPKEPTPAEAYGAATRPLPPAEKAPGHAHGIASAMIAPRAMRPPLHRRTPPNYPPAAQAVAYAAGAGGPRQSFQLPPPAALPKHPLERPKAPGFLVPYTGRDLLPGERVYPLQTLEKFKALALPIGMPPYNPL